MQKHTHKHTCTAYLRNFSAQKFTIQGHFSNVLPFFVKTKNSQNFEAARLWSLEYGKLAKTVRNWVLRKMLISIWGSAESLCIIHMRGTHTHAYTDTNKQSSVKLLIWFHFLFGKLNASHNRYFRVDSSFCRIFRNSKYSVVMVYMYVLRMCKCVAQLPYTHLTAKIFKKLWGRSLVLGLERRCC